MQLIIFSFHIRVLEARRNEIYPIRAIIRGFKSHPWKSFSSLKRIRISDVLSVFNTNSDIEKYAMENLSHLIRWKFSLSGDKCRKTFERHPISHNHQRHSGILCAICQREGCIINLLGQYVCLYMFYSFWRQFADQNNAPRTR